MGTAGTCLVVQWLDLLLFLAFADLARVRNLEELRGNFDQPFRFHYCHIMAVFPRCQDQLVVYQPFGRPIEQRGGRVDVDRGSFDQGLVPLLWIFLSGMSEEPRANCSSNKVVITTGRENIVLVPEEYKQTACGERCCRGLPVHDT